MKIMRCGSVVGVLCVMLLTVAGVSAESTAPGTSASFGRVGLGQTEGFGADKLLVFTYLQNFSCIHEPFDDLDHNGKVAAVDPREFQRPRCVVGHQPTIGPLGEPIDQTEKLWVLAPFFETDPDEPAFTPELGGLLKTLFGFVPDAFKIHPGVPVQCPEPDQGRTQHRGAPGTCTMHTSRLDLGPVLHELGLVPKDTTVFVPSLNHSHVIDEDDIRVKPIWWQVISVLVTDPSAWPNAEGTSGITSLDKLRDAQQEGKARADVPTNFFLFFGSSVQGEGPDTGTNTSGGH